MHTYSVLSRGLSPLAIFYSHDMYFQGARRMPLFSAQAKPGVCIVNEKLNLSMLCGQICVQTLLSALILVYSGHLTATKCNP